MEKARVRSKKSNTPRTEFYDTEGKVTQVEFITFPQYAEERGLDPKTQREKFTDFLDDLGGGADDKKRLKDMYRLNRMYCFSERYVIKGRGTDGRLDEVMKSLKKWKALSILEFYNLVWNLKLIRIGYKRKDEGKYYELSDEEDNEEKQFLDQCCWKWYITTILSRDTSLSEKGIRKNLCEPVILLIESIRKADEKDGQYLMKKVMKDLAEWYYYTQNIINYIDEIRNEEKWKAREPEKVYSEAQKREKNELSKGNISVLDYI